MELEKYRALVCAIESGSLTAAAEKLQYTPSGISRAVSALEAECGFSLLLREHGGVRPTAACQRLLPGIYSLLHSGEAWHRGDRHSLQRLLSLAGRCDR